ncbi:hypothetical protein MPSEU_000408800 [Mayamaea pseudoterrestris]|nr:hypothetical protein MPSEU_000408800 [Mayamaea pseudoterrestris]
MEQMLSSRIFNVGSMQRKVISSAMRRAAHPSSRTTRMVALRYLSSRQHPMLDSDNYAQTANKSSASASASVANTMLEREWSPPKDPWDLTDMLESPTVSYDTLPEWSAEHVSRTSLERIRIFEATNVENRTTSARYNSTLIPTLSELASMPLPGADPTLTETDHKLYALQRQRRQYQYILDQVKQLAAPRVGAIRALQDWQAKQDAVDVLFEDIETQLVLQEEILGKHPSFAKWVERALEEFLRSVQKDDANKTLVDAASGAKDDANNAEESVVAISDADALPIFMDCADVTEDKSDSVVPKILYPLQPRPGQHAVTVGMMVEDWELAAYQTTKRILLRQSTRRMAQALQDDTTQRIYVHGPQGVGKTAAIATIVAAARTSGAIVLYMPNGDDLHKNGFYMEPNEKQPGLFDLPVLSKNVCSDLLTSHEDDLNSIMVSKEILAKFSTDEQLTQLGYDGDVSATDLLQHGVSKVSHAPIAFSAVVEALMMQDQVDFYMVMDEFNCYFEKGYYYHGDYEDAKRPVPYQQISLFQPALDAMGIATTNAALVSQPPPRLMKRGAIVVGVTESHAVARKITDALTENAKQQQFVEGSDNEGTASNIQLIKIPRFSALEVDHVLANFEATGVGKLRLDRGETVRDEQEVARLRMVSSGVGQRLLDACIM